MRVNKWWQNYNIRVDYPFNLEKFTKNMHTVTAGHTHSDTQICETTAVWSCKTEALLSVIRCCLWTNNSLTNRTQYQDHKLPWTSPNKDVTVSSLGLPKPHIVPPLTGDMTAESDKKWIGWPHNKKKKLQDFGFRFKINRTHPFTHHIHITALFTHPSHFAAFQPLFINWSFFPKFSGNWSDCTVPR